jgi:hypothetical protein
MSINLPVMSLCTLITVIPCFFAIDVQAEFYKYKDSNGTLVITNKFEDVPQKYRKNVKVVWDEELAAKDPLARRAAAAEEHRKKQQPQQQENQGRVGTLQPTDGKTLVITFDEATGQLIRTME